MLCAYLFGCIYRLCLDEAHCIPDLFTNHSISFNIPPLTWANVKKPIIHAYILPTCRIKKVQYNVFFLHFMQNKNPTPYA
nr:MAG TPA: dead box helicase [Caudoviricetes sp.]